MVFYMKNERKRRNNFKNDEYMCVHYSLGSLCGDIWVGNRKLTKFLLKYILYVL